MSNGLVRFVMEVVGGSQVRQALRGVVAETRSADRQVAQSARSTAGERNRLLRSEGAEARRGAQQRVRAETEADRAIVQATRETTREQRRLRQAEAREMRRQLRDQERDGVGGRGGGARGNLRALGSVAVGVAQAIEGRVQGWQSALGAPSRDELIQRTMQNQLALIRATTSAGMTDRQAEAVNARVRGVARSTGTDTGQLTEGLVVAQNRFSQLQGFSDNLEAIALAARAVNAPVTDMVGALGEFQRQLGVSSEEVPQLLGLMADGMNQGSLEAGDVASNFSSIMSDFTALRGEGGRGVSGATEFLALAQGLGGAGAGPEGTRTLMQNMMGNLRRTEVQRDLERAMGDQNVFNDRGQMTIGFNELISRMAANPQLERASVMESVFGNDMQAASARNFLLEQTRNGRNPVEALMGASSDRGNSFIDTVNTRLDGSAAGQAMGIRASAEANFAENGDQLIRTMVEAVGPLSELTSTYPLATEALGFLRDAAGAASGALGSLGLINLATGGAGGGVLGALGLGSGVAGTGAAAAGGLSLAAAAPLALGGAALLGGAGAAYSRHQELTAEESRRAGAERALARDPSIVSAETLANATGDASLIGPGAARRRAGRQLGSAADANMAAFRGQGGPAEVRGQVDLAPDSVNALASALSRAIDRGAPAAGREPGEPGRRR